MHGTRGWNLLGEAEDEKIINRELLRLELSITEGIKKFGEGKEIIVFLHYPPVIKGMIEESRVIKLMQKYNVKRCFYGHLHGEALEDVIEGECRWNKFKTCERRLFGL